MLKKPKWPRLINSLAVQRIVAVFLGVLVVVYTVFHVSSLFGDDIMTVASGMMTESKVIGGRGYVFRDESVLYSQNTGVVDYIKADGSKVSVGERLADVYTYGSESDRELLSLIDKRIELLERSATSGYTLADLSTVNENISDTYYALSKLIASSDTGSLAKQADKLLYYMNCHSLITDPNSPVDNTLESLKQQRQTIITSGGQYVTESSADSGYFYHSVDGYEGYFTLEAANTLTAESFYTLANDTSPDTQSTVGSYGKLAYSHQWRFAIRVSELNEGYFKVGEQFDVEFIENGNVSIPMVLTSIIEDTVDGSGSILVFSADRLPDGFSFDRVQSVSITVSSVSGIYVPRSAVEREDGKYFVYVLDGSVVRVRYIEVIYEGSDYYLCDADAVSEDGSTVYLGLNELIITSGNNLFDGRILD